MKHESVRACERSEVRRLWDQLPKADSTYRQLDARSFENFYRLMQESCLIWELPVGFVRVEYERGTGMWLHAAFWSSDIFREVDAMREIALEIMETLGTSELHVAIPLPMKGLARYLERFGAVWRGVAPRYYRIGKDYCDALLYDIIREREEAYNG